eukprot:scaffold556_cov117-Skeletonema_dohrnii-CCMP3373.AAC.3
MQSIESNTAEEVEAVNDQLLKEEEMTDDDDIAAAANSRNDEASGNNMDDTEDFFDWEKIVHEAENGEDDSSSFHMDGVDDVMTDDELLDYVSDDESVLNDWEQLIEMKPRGYKPELPPPNELSEDSKALLFWRHEGEGKSFSDWKIKVEAETTEDCRETNATIYNVHRLTLAMGPKKSGYFEALLQSDSYSENSDCTSTVKLPKEVGKQFPEFLDYLYAQPVESKFVINFDNWKSMKYLANYFLVPRLTEAVAEFIEKDMECHNLEHMENYISEFHRDISDDMSRRILPKAVLICAELLQSIEVDSPLLMSIPPAMFRSIITRVHIDENDNQTALHTCSLVAAYLEHNVEDKSVFDIYFCEVMPSGPWFACLDESEDTTIELALTWFRLMTKKGWNLEDDDESCFRFFYIERVNWDLSIIISDYLRSKAPSLKMMERIVRGVPSDIVAKCFKESVDEARMLREGEDDESEDDEGLATKDIEFVRDQSRWGWEDAVRALKVNGRDATKLSDILKADDIPGAVTLNLLDGVWKYHFFLVSLKRRVAGRLHILAPVFDSRVLVYINVDFLL